MDIDNEIRKMTSRAMQRFSSLDETISTIKDEHAREMQEARDARVAAEIEAELCKKLLAEANLERDSYMRVAVKLISQFSMVEAVFADAKKLAIEYAAAQPQPPASYELEPEVSHETPRREGVAMTLPPMPPASPSEQMAKIWESPSEALQSHISESLKGNGEDK